MQNTLKKKQNKHDNGREKGTSKLPRNIAVEHQYWELYISWERALTILVNGYATYKQGKNQHQAPEGLEPPAFCLLGRRSANWAIEPSDSDGRTVDLMVT